MIGVRTCICSPNIIMPIILSATMPVAPLCANADAQPVAAPAKASA
jgi:hypothetical protein